MMMTLETRSMGTCIDGAIAIGAGILCATALWLCLAGAACAGTQTPIQTAGNGPWFQLHVPVEVYAGSRDAALSDLRVLNAQGQGVPFAWLDNPESGAREYSQKVPVYPLPASINNAPDARLYFRQGKDGSLQLAQSADKSAKGSQVQEWIFDASKLAGNLVQGHLILANDAQGVFLFSISSGNDLKQWQEVVPEASVTRLNGLKMASSTTVLEDLAFRLPSQPARYLRLRWLDPANAPRITGVTLDSMEQIAAKRLPMQWISSQAPTQCGVDWCDYAVPKNLPLHSLRLNLAEPNTLAQVQIIGLLPPQSPVPQRREHHLLHGLRHKTQPQTPATDLPAQQVLMAEQLVYRIQVPQKPGQEAKTPDIPLGADAWAGLRIRTVGPITLLGSTPPTLSLGHEPRSLVFLARGTGPFALKWVAPTDAKTDVPPIALKTLMPLWNTKTPLQADAASVTLPPVSSPPLPASPTASAPATPVPDGTRKFWVWGALGAGLLVLGGMVWSLLRQIKPGTPAPPKV